MTKRVTSAGDPSRTHAILERVISSLRARTLLACLLMVATIDSAAGVCAFMCSHRSEAASSAPVTASHSCHEAANAPGPDGSLAAVPVPCAPERAALTTARLEGPAFNYAVLLPDGAAVVDVVSPARRAHLVDSGQSPPPGAPPGAPLPLRI